MYTKTPALLFVSSILLASSHGAAQSPPLGIVHTASSSNSSSNSTYLEHPSLNGNPAAIAFVTPVHSASAKHVGLWYDINRQRWAVFNEDKSPMEAGRSFHVIASPPSSVRAKIHTVSSANTNSNSSYIDSPDTNERPFAIVFVSQRWNGTAGGYNPRAVGVWYDASAKKWAVYNEDKSPITAGLQFNVMVAAAPSSAANPAVSVIRVSSDAKLPKSIAGSNDVLMVSHSYQSSGPYLNAYFDVGLEPDSGQWTLFSPTPFQKETIFNVLSFKR